MEISKSDIVAKIRTAIDDILPNASDSFASDTDAELWQATQHAVQSLLETAPLNMLAPKNYASHYGINSEDHVINNDGSGYLVVDQLYSVSTPSPGYLEVKKGVNFLRFVSLKLTSWKGGVTELIEPGGDKALRQSSMWGRGSATKPCAMLDYVDNYLVLRYWTAGKENGVYDHSISDFSVIAQSLMNGTVITCDLRDNAERQIIYQAAAIFFEGKKESEIADKFRNI